MNIPNKLSILRILLIPVLMFFYLTNFVAYSKLIACLIFIIAIITDFLDGYLARKNNQVTDLGKFLDPIADKLLVISSLTLLVADSTIPAPYGVFALLIIIARDLIVNLIRQVGADKRVVIAADKMGKLKTLIQDLAIVFLFIISQNNSATLDFFKGQEVFEAFSFALLAVAVALTILSGFNYLIKNRNLFK